MDFQKIGYWDETFIMVQQASKVFYVKYPTSKHWYVVLHEKKTNKREAIDDIENGDPPIDDFCTTSALCCQK